MFKSIIKIAAATAFVVGIHSLLASKAAKKKASELLGERKRNGLYRPLYNVLAIITFGALGLYGSKLPNRELYKIRGSLRWLMHKLLEPVKEKVSDLLFSGTLSSHSKTGKTCSKILKLELSLWTFSQIEGVEPTNNQAERALRRAVLWRRKSFGTQSELGSRFVERILTVVTTLRQQRRSVLDYLKRVCAAGVAGENLTEFNLPVI